MQLIGGVKINKKTLAVSLILLATVAAVMGALAATTLASADTNSITKDNAIAPQTTIQDENSPQSLNGIFILNSQGFGGPRNRQCEPRLGPVGGMGGIDVSSEYTANVNTILNSDTDVANLISQGYNVTAIHPIVKTVLQGDGTLITHATSAVVLMINGPSGYATVNIDIANSHVTTITTVTRTVIDKSSS